MCCEADPEDSCQCHGQKVVQGDNTGNSSVDLSIKMNPSGSDEGGSVLQRKCPGPADFL